MPQSALRFAVRDGDRRGATWKLWAERGRGKSDVYLACRALGGALKTSLHESGQWHVAFSKDAFENHVVGAIPSVSDRFVEKWPRPAQLGSGPTLAYRIVVPFDAITSNVTERDYAMIWIPSAPSGKAVEIDILLASEPLPVGEWPGRRGTGTSLVGSFSLDNGDTTFAVFWNIDMPAPVGPRTASGRFFRGASSADLVGGDPRAIAFGSEPDGSRTIYDLAVRVQPQGNDPS